MQVCYDLETYPNFFLCGVKPLGQDPVLFEISERRNDLAALRSYIMRLSLMIGFNNLHFDYPVLHHVIALNEHWWPKVQAIFAEEGGRFDHELRPWEWLVPQLDLFRIHHFDNPAKRTSLKQIEFALQLPSVEDLPIEPGSMLTFEQMDALRLYNACSDLPATEKFYYKSKSSIDLRAALGKHTMNYNDTKLGKQFIIRRLEERQPGICYYMNKKPRQTPRPEGFKLAETIFPYIRFERPGFQALLQQLREWTILTTRGDFHYCDSYGQEHKVKKIYYEIDGFIFPLAMGGTHGSVKDRAIIPAADELIWDIDAESFYPSIAIVNRLAPAHLGETYCDVYAELKRERLSHPKGSPENIQLKYGLNGTYGDSNNPNSPFYDPQYTMATTINGQLLLFMLAEQLMKHGELIQINTDGLTIKFPRYRQQIIEDICNWWQQGTCIKLERVEYTGMWIRDVNAYIARRADGKIKHKGPYAYENLEWNKDHGCLVARRAASAVMLDGANPVQFLRSWPNPFDFFELAKAPSARGSRMETATGRVLTKHTRFYVSLDGDELIAIHPPKGKRLDYEPKSILKNRKVTICNKIDAGFRMENIDWDYYLQRTRKLIIKE